jgi:Ras family protein T1
MPKDSTIRTVLLGDAGVGKSSIVSALIKESFVELPPDSVLPPVTIPSDAFGSSSSSFNLTTVICDTSPRPQDRVYLENELRKADVVIICYAVDDAHSFDRVALYWLPYIRSQGSNLPVILVGNKIDLRLDSPDSALDKQALEAEIFPVMQAWKEIEVCVECSAKTCTNIGEPWSPSRAALSPIPQPRSFTLPNELSYIPLHPFTTRESTPSNQPASSPFAASSSYATPTRTAS